MLCSLALNPLPITLLAHRISNPMPCQRSKESRDGKQPQPFIVPEQAGLPFSPSLPPPHPPDKPAAKREREREKEHPQSPCLNISPHPFTTSHLPPPIFVAMPSYLPPHPHDRHCTSPGIVDQGNSPCLTAAAAAVPLHASKPRSLGVPTQCGDSHVPHRTVSSNGRAVMGWDGIAP